MPPVYVFAAIQYAAITVPFWDHTELVRWIVAWHDGNGDIESLWAPHNHSRPLVYRVTMLLNALATRWDIRSEYAFIYASMAGAFLLLVGVLYRLRRRGEAASLFAHAAVLSAIFFSPAGHNNHWWSMMFQLHAANTFIIAAFLLAIKFRERVAGQCAAAACCWLATYSLTNGLVAFAALAIAMLLSSPRMLRSSWQGMFWLGNLAFISCVYLPGLPETPQVRPRSVAGLLSFTLAYLGSPVRGLLAFPYKSQFDLPVDVTASAICGLVVLMLVLGVLYYERDAIRRNAAGPCLLLVFGLFAVGSAILTAWGRSAFDEYGVAHANASRYTMFSSYALYGLILYSVGPSRLGSALKGRQNSRVSGMIVACGLMLFTAAAIRTYWLATQVYIDSHQFNATIAQAFTRGDAETPFDTYIHPNQQFVASLKKDLSRLRYGPYWLCREGGEDVDGRRAVGEYRKPFVLTRGAIVRQRFQPSKTGLSGIQFLTVTWGNSPSLYDLRYQVARVSEVGEESIVARGVLHSAALTDWGTVTVTLDQVESGDPTVYELLLHVDENVDDSAPVGVPLHRLVRRGVPFDPVIIGSLPASEPLVLPIDLLYEEF